MLRRSKLFWGFLCLFTSTVPALADAGLTGIVTDPQGRAVSGATLRLVRRDGSARREARTDATGIYRFDSIDPGEYRLTLESEGFPIVERQVTVKPDLPTSEPVQFSRVASQNQSVMVSANVEDVGVFAPDPAQRLMIRDETLDANPGRPGMPISVPGMPVESPAGGVKPPQYFVPGVAGDHGEPIAMFFQVGGFLFPNNLPANAHGNGYADPNVVIPLAIESLQTDGAAFNVREGNNSVNAAILFGLRDRIEPMVRLTTDYRDVNLVAAWSPRDVSNKEWAGAEVSYGNGFLDRLEHRKQYKGNVSKVFTFGKHSLTVYGIGYYGFAFQPGLIPVGIKTRGRHARFSAERRDLQRCVDSERYLAAHGARPVSVLGLLSLLHAGCAAQLRRRFDSPKRTSQCELRRCSLRRALQQTFRAIDRSQLPPRGATGIEPRQV